MMLIQVYIYIIYSITIALFSFEKKRKKESDDADGLAPAATIVIVLFIAYCAIRDSRFEELLKKLKYTIISTMLPGKKWHASSDSFDIQVLLIWELARLVFLGKQIDLYKEICNLEDLLIIRCAGVQNYE